MTTPIVLTEPERSALRKAAQLLRENVPADDPDKTGAAIVADVLDGVSARVPDAGRFAFLDGGTA